LEQGTGAATNNTWCTFIRTGPLVIVITHQMTCQEETEQYRVRITDEHWMGCWFQLHCSASTQLENKNSSWPGPPYFKQPSWHKMTLAVNMARNNQEMEQQSRARPRKTSTRDKDC
jgi:hypothetical protein